MANTLYDQGRQEFLTGDINWLSHDIKAILVDKGEYTPNFTNNKTLSDIPVGAIVGSAVLLTGKSATGGAADANDITFSSVTGPSIEAIILYKDTGDAQTSTLIAHIDTATGLPITPNGGDIIINWDNGANKIFKL